MSNSPIAQPVHPEVSPEGLRNGKRKQGPHENGLVDGDTRQVKRSSKFEERSSTHRDLDSQAESQSEKNPKAALEPPLPFPKFFNEIERSYRALNLVYTFCSARKHLLTTYENLKPAVENHIGRGLSLEDIALMVALRPESILFAYMDELMLQLDIKGSEKDDVFKASGSAKAQAFALDASVGGWTGQQGLCDTIGRDSPAENGKEVLYIEFLDGDLRRQVQDKKTGEPTRPTLRLKEEKLKIPVYGQKQMMTLIERRNQRFCGYIKAFLKECVERNLDPEMILRERAQNHIPKPSTKQKEATEPATGKLPHEIPKERKSITSIIQEIKQRPWYTGQIVPDGHRVFEPQEAIYGNLNFLLSQNLVNALYNAKGITQFYAHQSEALNKLSEGQNVVVATSTSSGKSLIYQLPILHALEWDRNSRAMYIFPTKALAQDQKRSLREMIAYMPGLEDIVVETFDGDTPMTMRNEIREEARIIFTNPDMLHVTILPQEERWRSFLQNLKFVVVDELHYYNGQMGSHVAFIMRRLRRVCAAVGNSSIKFISCSATVANPRGHFQTIFGISNVHLIDYDGSPSGRKEFLCWNTPYKEPSDPASGRGNTKLECARLFCDLLLRGVRIIAFCRVRAQTETLVNAIQQEFKEVDRPDCGNLVMAYRGGYTAADRRRIESEMFEGKLRGIVATTALELGIDIGSLDCVLTWGFPYTIANLRQQSGRAGRRNKDSLSILVGDSFPTDQHYMQNPDELFSKPNCELQVDLENMLVREGHIQCAAYEMPIQPKEDAKYFGQDLAQICQERLLQGDDEDYFHCHDRYRPQPSKFVSIRDTEDDHFAIVDITNGRNVVLEELEASRASFTLYDGAIFLHQGKTYLVKDFLPDQGMAKVEKVNVHWTTRQREFTDIDPTEIEVVRQISGSPSHAYLGTIRIQQNVFGFFKIDHKNRILDAVQVDNPPVVRHSKGLWVDVPRQALRILQSRHLNVAAAIHAAEHAVMSLMPTFVISMPEDVRTECKVAIKEFAKMETQRKRPARLTFYDAKGGAGGSGITTKAFDHIDHLLRCALQRVEGCHCQRGCVECVASEVCKQANQLMSKAGSCVVLKSLLSLEVNEDELPMGPEDFSPVGIETVVIAPPVPMKGSNAKIVDDTSMRRALHRRDDENRAGGFEAWAGCNSYAAET